MTAANEKPITCPCCGSGSINRWPNEMYEYDCNDCGCGWDESARRAQPAEAVDEAKEREAAWRRDFAGYLYGFDEAENAKGWYEKGWIARARGGRSDG